MISDDWPANSSGDGALEGARVLVLEDDADNRELLVHLLTTCGSQAVGHATAAEALEAIRRSPPDLIVADLGLPGMDGFAFLEAVRRLAPALGGVVPAVAVSAYVRRFDVERSLKAGFDVHLQKPLQIDRALEVFARLVRRRRR